MFTGQTPKKAIARQIEQGKVCFEVTERWNQCQGRMIMIMDDPKTGTATQKKCAVCDRRTSWFCLQCHGWFCMNPKKGQVNDTMYNVNANGDKMLGFWSCYAKKHCLNWN